MAYTRTLLQLRTSLLIRGQYENSQDITAVVANELINDALEEAFNPIVERWDDFYVVTSPTFVTVSGTSAYALPTDFYKLRKVEILASGLATDATARWERLYPISIDDKHRHTVLRGKRYKYWESTAGLSLVPTPAAVETLRLMYVPLAPQLVLDTDTVQFDVPVEQKLVLHLALRDVYERQNLSTDGIDAKIARLVGQLRTASDHDAGEPFYLGSSTGGEDEDDY
jgi:hypothetical protein